MKIYNVKIKTMDSDRRVIENGWVEITDGIISAVESGSPEAVTAEDIDGNGRTVYPGFIDIHTHLGLSTSGVGMEGEDFNEESEPCTAHIRIVDGINPIDYSFELARKAGVTCCLVSPGSANPVAGSIAAVKTYGKRIDKMLVGTVGMKFSMGENPKLTYSDKEDAPYTRMAVAGIIREALIKAQKYGEAVERAMGSEEDMPEFDMKSEALLPVLRGEVKAHFHCHRADDIFTAVRIAKEFGLDAVLVHCTEGHINPEKLAAEHIPAIVGPIIATRTKPELANQTEATAAVLKKAGVEVAICTDHPEVPIKYLPLSAAIAVRYGMSHDDAICAITSVPARILKLDRRIGSVAPGMDADITAFAGDPLSVYEEPVWVVAGGRIVKRS